jgi:hypothetical protein
MYATAAVLPAVMTALRKRGFETQIVSGGRSSTEMAVKRMTYSAIRLLTAESASSTAAILGLNAASAKDYEESIQTFWHSEAERNQWIDDVVGVLRANYSESAETR